MSLNNTPAAERVHIGIFGRRNAGKSSLINALTSQNLAIVSDVKGTTTDPVAKSMELLPLGPVVLIDTPGLDDTGDLGALRVQKAHQTLNKTDIAILVVDASSGVTAEDQRILSRIREKQIPCLVAVNKSDLDSAREIPKLPDSSAIEVLPVSAKTGQGIEKLKERIAALAPKEEENRRIVGDLGHKGHLIDAQTKGIAHLDLHLLRPCGGEFPDIEVQQQPVLEYSEAQPCGQRRVPVVQACLPQCFFQKSVGPGPLPFTGRQRQ